MSNEDKDYIINIAVDLIEELLECRDEEFEDMIVECIATCDTTTLIDYQFHMNHNEEE